MDQQSIYQQPEYQQNTYQQNTYQQEPQPEFTPGEESKYQPISTWGYVGIMLLMCVPCVGLIFLIVWAAGGCRKVNKRNFARAALILMAISLVFTVITGFILRKVITTAMEENGWDSFIASDDDESFDLSTLETLGALSNGDLSALEDLSEEELEVLSELAGVDLSEVSDMYYDEYYDDEYYDDEYYDDEYEDNYYEDEYDGWPEDYLPPYPNGDGEYISATRTAFYDTTVEEMMAYVDDLKLEAFEFEDFYDFGVTEEDVITKNMWWGYDGYMYVFIYFEDGTVYIEHTLELPEIDW